MSLVRKMVLIAALALSMITAPAAGAWSNYFGPGWFYDPSLGGPDAASSGSNYWTNNRVYRPTGHPFWLAHDNSSGTHWSAVNWSSNPFYFTPYGYSQLACLWNYYDDGSSSVYPVTCQGDS